MMGGRGRISNGFNSNDLQERSELKYTEFNSSGLISGSSTKQNHFRDNGNPKLHVTNIPAGVDEKGLRNIFGAECSIPIRVYISKNRKNIQANTYWGFVEYKTLAEANAAIRAVHKKPPYELFVQFSKASQDCNKVVGEKSPQGNMGPSSRNQGQSPPAWNLSHNSFREPYSNDESCAETFGENNSHCRFSAHGSPSEHNTSNSRERLPGLPIEKYSHVDISDEMDLHVAAYVSNRAKDLTLDDLSALCSEIKLALPFKPGQCTYCLRTAIYTCSRCKTWYCSDFCRTTHWPQHKENCAPRSVVFQKDGALTYKDIPDAFCNEDSAKQKNFAVRSPRGSQGRSFSSGYRNDTFYNQNDHENMATFDNMEKVQDNIDSRSPDDNRGGRDNSKGVDRGSKGGQKNNCRGGGGKQGQGGGRSDKKVSANWNKTSEDDSVKPLELLHVDQQISQNSIFSNLDKAPILANKFTEVTVGAVGNEGEFWAYKVEDYSKQGAMINELNHFSLQCGGPADVRIDLGTKCVAPYQGDWYRAEIIKIFRDNVRVVFIDFGNDSDVKKCDLKLLPSHLSTEPPMAHKYILAVSSENPKLQEEFTFSIKPIILDKYGRWVVHAEGVHYPDINGFEDI